MWFYAKFPQNVSYIIYNEIEMKKGAFYLSSFGISDLISLITRTNIQKTHSKIQKLPGYDPESFLIDTGLNIPVYGYSPKFLRLIYIAAPPDVWTSTYYTPQKSHKEIYLKRLSFTTYK